MSEKNNRDIIDEGKQSALLPGELEIHFLQTPPSEIGSFAKY